MVNVEPLAEFLGPIAFKSKFQKPIRFLSDIGYFIALIENRLFPSGDSPAIKLLLHFVIDGSKYIVPSRGKIGVFVLKNVSSGT